MKIVFACAVVLLLAHSAAHAWSAIGFGTRSCGAWAEDRRSTTASMPGDEDWVLGFLSGVGSVGIENPLHGVDAQGVWGWIDNYCQAHPLDPIAKAAEAFVSAHPK